MKPLVKDRNKADFELLEDIYGYKNIKAAKKGKKPQRLYKKGDLFNCINGFVYGIAVITRYDSRRGTLMQPTKQYNFVDKDYFKYIGKGKR